MKRNTCLLLVLSLPLWGLSQGVKTNLFDKFLKKQRIETEPVAVAGLENNNKLSLDFSAVASSLYLNLSGAGWGASTVDRENQLVLLFANDSAISLKAAALQSFEPGPAQNVYRHQYSLTLQDLNRLSRYDLVGLRKYSFDASSEIRLPKENQGSIRRLSALFLATLKEANITSTVKEISVKDIRNYTGDSVKFCSKIYRTRYFQGSEDGPTLLDVQADFSDPLVNVVILEKDRQKFHNTPETVYLNREVCISGVVRLRNNLPYVVIRNRDQIKLTSSVSVADAGLFDGDSVTVAGKVVAASLRQNGKTPQLLLNMGASTSGQPLTVVMEGAESGANLSPSTYQQQVISVSGPLVKTDVGLQLSVRHKNQLQVLLGQEASLSFAAAQDNQNKVQNQTGNETSGDAQVNESLAEFPGGADAFLTYLEKTIPGSVTAGNNRRQVMVSFEIDAQGTCSGIRIAGSPNSVFDLEVEKALRNMPRWKPAFRNGHFVVTRITQPIFVNSYSN